MKFSMKQRIKIKATDFWSKDIMNFYLFKLLAKDYDLVMSDEPDLLLFSVFGYEHLKYTCLKIFYTGENVKPNFKLCDYSFSFEDTDERNFQLPHLAVYPFFQEFRKGQYSPKIQSLRNHPKVEFCNFFYSNPRPKERIIFCQKLMNYKRVDCPGKVLKNMESIDSSGGKMQFLKKYKFTIAFENHSAVNYTTEKIYHPLLVGSIPIYWGNPKVAEFFNPESFVNCHDYDSFEEVIERVIEIDNDDSLYEKYISAPPILKDSKINLITEEEILDRLNKIVRSVSNLKPVSKSFSYKYYRSFLMPRALLSKGRKYMQRHL